MKPKALNYAAQAEAGMRQLAEVETRRGEHQDAMVATWIADQIREAVHFSLPDNGRIFDDNLRGIRDTTIRLPFPKITAEYYSDIEPEKYPAEVGIVKVPRRLILAFEETAEGTIRLLNGLSQGWLSAKSTKWIADFQKIYADGCIVVIGIFAYREDLWAPCAAAWLMPASGWDDAATSECIEPLRELSEGARKISGRPCILLHHMFSMVAAELGFDMAIRHIANDIGPEAGVILELIEAMTCSNVRASVVQTVKPGVNERRIRDGKLPLYETKILTIDASPISSISGAPRGPLASGRNAPRQHLRRGHIRTLQSGARIWVQAHSVGTHGAINKAYKIKV